MKRLDPKSKWLFFFRYISGAFFVVFFFSVFVFINTLSYLTSNSFLNVIGIWLFASIILSILLAFIWANLTYHFYKYEMSENAFKKEHGIIWKKYVSIPYDRIQNVDIYRGLIARILGLSDLQIQTAAGITMGSYGAFSEGRLPGVTKEEAEKLRNDLLSTIRNKKDQGL